MPRDEFQDRFLAQLLRSQAPRLASRAAGARSALLISGSPRVQRGTAQTPADDPAVPWAHLAAKSPTQVEHFTARLFDLAAAIGAGRPEIFASQIVWARIALEARDCGIDELRLSLGVLRDAVMPEVPPEDAPAVSAYFNEATAALDRSPPTDPPRLTADTPHGRLAAEYLRSILEGDRTAACDRLVAAVHRGVPPRDIYLKVLVPAQHELGRMWHLGEIHVAEEHFATTTTQAAAAVLFSFADRKPRDGRVILAAAVQGNTHDLGVRMLADFFEMEGWRVIVLGADVPVQDLVAGVRDYQPHLVALSAAIAVHLDPLRESIVTLRGEPGLRRVPVIVGGPALAGVDGLWRELGADGFAPNIEEAVALGDRLVPKPVPPR